ncbi:MAG: hypothetical protein WBR18_09445 [Anaerolineales bacterium]
MSTAQTTTIQSERDRASDQLRWYRISRPIFDRFPWTWQVTTALLIVIVTGEQFAEELLLSGEMTPQRLLYRLLLTALAVYLLLAILFLKRQMLRGLFQLRRAVDLEEMELGGLLRRTVRPSRVIEFALLGISALIVIGLFVGAKSEFPLGGTLAMATSWPAAVLILFTYTLIGWLGLSLIHAAVQHALGLRRLASSPLIINVFDPDNLVPFGTLGMLHSMVLAGVIVLLMIPLGTPSGPAGLFVVGLSSVGSLLALILPIWGVYLQTREAKDRALNRIYDELAGIQDQLLDAHQQPADELNARTNALVNLRKIILEVPNWPFRSTTTIVRALTAATSPLIYFLLIEMVRAYLVPVLIR